MNLIANAKLLMKKMLPAWAVQNVRKYRYVKAVKNSKAKERPVIKDLVSPGDIVVDIGANYGWYTVFLSELVGMDGIVHSIEPVPSTFKILKHNSKKLRLTNVSLYQCAISDKSDSVKMTIPINDNGQENLYLASIKHEYKNDKTLTISVNTRTLDSFFPDKSVKISFIKCDIEGNELNCLRGAGDILKHSKPAWFMEIMGDPDDNASEASEVFRILHESGYRSFIYKNGELHERSIGERNVDYFFLNRSHIEYIKSRNNIGMVLKNGPTDI